jgi:DNA primase
MSSAAETIKERLGIVEVVSSYTKIDKAGMKNMQWMRPVMQYFI